MTVRVELSGRGTGKTTRMVAGVSRILKSRGTAEPIVIAAPNLNILGNAKDMTRFFFDHEVFIKTDIWWLSFPRTDVELIKAEYEMRRRGITAAFVDEFDMMKPIPGIAELFSRGVKDSCFYGTLTRARSLDDLEAHLAGTQYDPVIAILQANKWQYVSHTKNVFHFT